MLSRKSLLILVICLFCVSDVGGAVMCARLKSVSAGEDHTITLADNNTLWACGSNEYYQLGIGNVGDQWSLVRVHDGDMNTPSDYLEDINGFDAGWKHSLALDVNCFVWAWGNNQQGQLGDGGEHLYETTPIQVLSGEQDPGNPNSFLKYIIAISAGRSGEHSLAVDANGFVYAWGKNVSGECGNGKSGTGEKEYTPVLVLDDDPETEDTYLGDIAIIIQVDAGVDHSIALDNEGHVWHWGYGSDTETYPEKVKDSNGQELSKRILKLNLRR